MRDMLSRNHLRIVASYQNMPYAGDLRFKIASHARSHGMSKARIMYALANVEWVDEDTELGKIAFFGLDPQGLRLRLVGRRAADDETLIIIIHAMPADWTKGRKW